MKKISNSVIIWSEEKKHILSGLPWAIGNDNVDKTFV